MWATTYIDICKEGEYELQDGCPHYEHAVCGKNMWGDALQDFYYSSGNVLNMWWTVYDRETKIFVNHQDGGISIKEFSYPENNVRVHPMSEDCSGDFREQYEVRSDHNM